MPDPRRRVTRLAPSPTGALHLGNALTFMTNWAMARKLGWEVVLRVEDLDGTRIKPGSADQAIAVLRWLGMDWDRGPLYQRHDLKPYHEALSLLRDRGLIYACQATRKQIEAALSAPNEGDHELRYPGPAAMAQSLGPQEVSPPLSLQARMPLLEDDAYAWRLVVPDREVAYVDELHGNKRLNVQQQVGDFVVASKAGLPAYQLAVVVDDARQGITDIVRGDDLMDSAPRQRILYEALGLVDEQTPPPGYYHLPMVYGPDGLRLAKRHGDTRLVYYQSSGVCASRVIGLLAYWGGLQAQRTPMSASEYVRAFDPDKIRLDPIHFCAEDEAWLQAE